MSDDAKRHRRPYDPGKHYMDLDDGRQITNGFDVARARKALLAGP